MRNTFGSQWKIPKTWEIISIKSITSDWRGGAPFQPDDFTEEGFPVLHKGAIHKSGAILIDTRKKTFTSAEYAQCYQKSVIDSTYMAVTLRDLVPSGPSIGLIANLANSQSEKYVLAQGAYGFHIDTDKVHPSYLVWLSNYEPFRAYMKSYAVGSTQIHIRTPVFQELEIPLPPIEEQKRIAAILDKADRVRRKRQEAIRLTEELGRSIFLDMFGDPVTNPKGWEIKKLSTTFSKSPQIGIIKPAHADGHYPVIRVGEIGNREVNLEKCGKVTLSEQETEKFRCNLGDVLLARAIGSESHLGKASMLQETNQTIVFDSHVMRLRFDLNIMLPDFFIQWLTTQGGRHLFMKKAGRTAVQFNVNGKQISSIDIPLPPVHKQREFSIIYSKLMNSLSKGENIQELNNNLFNSLLQRAFRGEL
jgi:type I restriction enzyme, S subunit